MNIMLRGLVHRPCWRFAMLATFALWLLCLLPVHSLAEGATHGDLVRDRLQQLLDHWGYYEWWSMWEQGTTQSRSAISKGAFAHRMDSSPWRLACCDKRLRNLQVTPVSPQHVVVSATLLFETKQPRPVERPHSITLSFYLEEEQWALLQFQLFTHRDLWAWLDEPFTGPPVVAEAEQLVLAEVA